MGPLLLGEDEEMDREDSETCEESCVSRRREEVRGELMLSRKRTGRRMPTEKYTSTVHAR
jgi:hypothetical protein